MIVNSHFTSVIKQVDPKMILTRAVVKLYFRTTNATTDVSEAGDSYPLSSPPDVPSVLRRPSSSVANAS